MLPFLLIKRYAYTAGHIFLQISTDDVGVLPVSSPLPPQLYAVHFYRPGMPDVIQNVAGCSPRRMDQE